MARPSLNREDSLQMISRAEQLREEARRAKQREERRAQGLPSESGERYTTQMFCPIHPPRPTLCRVHHHEISHLLEQNRKKKTWWSPSRPMRS